MRRLKKTKGKEGKEGTIPIKGDGELYQAGTSAWSASIEPIISSLRYSDQSSSFIIPLILEAMLHNT